MFMSCDYLHGTTALFYNCLSIRICPWYLVSILQEHTVNVIVSGADLGFSEGGLTKLSSISLKQGVWGMQLPRS